MLLLISDDAIKLHCIELPTITVNENDKHFQPILHYLRLEQSLSIYFGGVRGITEQLLRIFCVLRNIL